MIMITHNNGKASKTQEGMIDDETQSPKLVHGGFIIIIIIK